MITAVVGAVRQSLNLSVRFPQMVQTIDYLNILYYSTPASFSKHINNLFKLVKSFSFYDYTEYCNYTK